MSCLPEELRFLAPIQLDDMVRIGRRRDGGYVLPARALEPIDTILSFGVCDDWSFEQALLARRPGLPVHCYDHTVGEQVFLADLAAASSKISTWGRVPKRLETCLSYNSFFRGDRVHFPQRVIDRAESAQDATIAQIFERAGAASNVLVKMDIEGGEYAVIPDLLNVADRITAMVVEFHDTTSDREAFVSSVKHLKQAFELVHIHANNYRGVAADGLPEVLEITFLNRRLCCETAVRDRLPVAGLDFPNNPRTRDWSLAFP